MPIISDVRVDDSDAHGVQDENAGENMHNPFTESDFLKSCEIAHKNEDNGVSTTGRFEPHQIPWTGNGDWESCEQMTECDASLHGLPYGPPTQITVMTCTRMILHHDTMETIIEEVGNLDGQE